MKRLVILLFVFSILLLTGCDYREIDRGYLVTAVGFTEQRGSVKIYIEAISSPDVSDSPPERVVLTDDGNNLQNAFESLKLSLVKPLYFEQMGAVVVGGSLNDKIISFLESIPSINYGIFIVKTDDINALFEAQTPSGVLGYDIIGLVKTNTKIKNQLYQINRKDFRLPTVNFKDDKLTFNDWEDKV